MITAPAYQRPDSISAFAAWGTLVVFILLYILSIFDRQVLALLLIPIQNDLGVSDLQLGLLHGVAFSLFYAFAGLALGWAVDRYTKKWLLFFGVVIWAVMTVACGLAQSFAAMFVARMLVGLGEAVIGPTSFAVLSAIFPKERLGLVMGLFYSASNLGSALIFIGGGAIITLLNANGGMEFPLLGMLKPWQAAFVIVGAPGVVMAFLSFLIVEPKIHRAKAPTTNDRATTGASAEPPPGVRAFVRENRRILSLHIGIYTLLCCNALASMAWAPTYLGRTFGWTPLEIGLVIGLSNGVFGLLGNIFWGWLADRQVRGGRKDGIYRTYTLALILGGPVGAATFLIPSPWVAVVGLCLTWVLLLGSGPFNAALSQFVPPPLRGRISALSYLSVAMIALGLTPVLVGLITDRVFGDRAMVGVSIALVVGLSSISALVLLRFASRPFIAAIDRNMKGYA